MGLAASQARMLLLVARKSDLEYRGQMINQRRMNLAWQTEALAKTYTDAMTNRTLAVKGETTGTADSELNITAITAKGFDVVDANGKKITDADLGDNNKSSETLQARLRAGTYHMEKVNTDEDIDWRTNSAFNDKLNEEDDEAAKATYEYESLKIQTQDKQLEIELKNVDTQHNAVQTEMDAVKKVIEKNIESSFKTFG